MNNNFENTKWLEEIENDEIFNDNAGDTEKISDEERNEEDTVIGVCPVCGNVVKESPRAFYCDAPQCRFIMWKNNLFLTSKGKELDADMARELLGNQKTYVTDFVSRRTKYEYAAWLHMSVMENGKVYYRLEFPGKAD